MIKNSEAGGEPLRGRPEIVLQLGLVACLLLAPLAAGAQANRDRVMEPIPPQRPIRARAPAATPQPAPAPAPAPGGPVDRSAGSDQVEVSDEGLVNLDFQDVELAVVIDTIAKLTSKNFVYDDRVRGRVTIVSPTPIPVEQAYTVFESILQVKGFTTVEAPGGVLKVIPIRDAKETSIDTRRSRGAAAVPDTDRFVTRLIPLSYIDAEQISNTLKPLVSKEAALVAYQPTNTIILTDSAANIRRVLSILEAIDVETFKQELALIRLQYADAAIVASQLSELFGVDVSSTAGRPTSAITRARPRPQTPPQPGQVTSPEAAQRGQVRIITDERTNSLVALASRSTLEEIRDFIRRIDVPVEGGGRIQVYYLKHADAEELAETLNSLLGGGPIGGAATSAAGQVTPQIAGQVSDLAAGVGTVTADVATNSLLIQASPEGYQALLRVIELLDIARPQVLVEALIMEVTVGDGQDLGFNLVARVLGEPSFGISSRTDSPGNGVLATNPPDPADDNGDTGDFTDLAASLLPLVAGPAGFIGRLAIRNEGEDIIRAVIRASANDSSVNVLSAPHILTSDNEEAEILVGDNIPIITSRVQSASTTVTETDVVTPATSVNVERQDIGVTLRVTPQITEGDTMRLDIFQEITALNSALQVGVGDPEEVGPALSNRRIENSVVLKDGETVVIGGLISDDYTDTVTKVPWLGDIPVLGWLFKTTSTDLTKRNLLVFLTPRVIRGAEDLEKQSIVKREEFRRHSLKSKKDAPLDEFEEPIGVTGQTSDQSRRDPAQRAVAALDRRYPIERMLEIERTQAVAKEQARQAATSRAPAKRYLVLGGVFADPGVAQSTLTRLVDAGYEGTLVSSRASGRVMLELQIGPYADLEAAERAAEALRLGYALSPQVVVKRAETAEP